MIGFKNEFSAPNHFAKFLFTAKTIEIASLPIVILGWCEWSRCLLYSLLSTIRTTKRNNRSKALQRSITSYFNFSVRIKMCRPDCGISLSRLKDFRHSSVHSNLSPLQRNSSQEHRKLRICPSRIENSKYNIQRNGRTLATSYGSGILQIASILDGFGQLPFSSIIKPRYSTSVIKNEHFSSRTWKPHSSILLKSAVRFWPMLIVSGYE